MLQFALACLVAAALPAPVRAVDPVPYTATYAVSYRGLNAGLVHFELRCEAPGTFVFGSHVEPSLLARLVVSDKIVEASTMRIDAEGVRPLRWFAEGGTEGEENDGSLVFSWNEGRVEGTLEGEATVLPTVPGLQDRLSIQIAVMTALLRAREPGTIPMVAEDRVKRYRYTRAGSERVGTPAGEFDSVVYESTRPGSSRLSRIWHARQLDYVPVRAEQIRNGRLETVMELVEIERPLLPACRE